MAAKEMKSNIWKFYLMRVFATFVFTTPVYVLFLQDNGLNLTQVMMLQSFYTIIMLLSLVPSGAFADLFGRKRALVASHFLYCLAHLILALSYNFFGFLAAEVVFGISSALWVSSGSAFLYDSLKVIKKEAEFNKKIGIATFINNMGWGFGSLVGGFIALVSLRLTFLISVPFTAISFLVCLTFKEPEVYTKSRGGYFRHITEAARFASKHAKVRFLIIYAMIWSGIMFIVFFLYQPYMLSAGIKQDYFGWVYFAFYIIIALFALLSHKIEGFFGEKKTLVFLVLVPVIAMTMLFLLKSWSAVFFLVVLSTMWGLFDPTIETYVQKLVKSRMRATISSFKAFCFNIFVAVFSPLLGWIADLYTVKTAMLISAVGLLVGLTMLLLMFATKNNKREETGGD